MITVKEFAKSQHRTVQAVYQSINRYKVQLQDHIKKVGRTSYLDDEAVAFLESKREQNPVVVYQQDKDEELETLRKNADVMKAQIAKLLEEASKSKDEYTALLEEKHKLELLPAETEKKLALTEKDLAYANEKLEEKTEQLKTATEESERQKQEIARLTEELRIEASKTWWQKLWHK